MKTYRASHSRELLVEPDGSVIRVVVAICALLIAACSEGGHATASLPVTHSGSLMNAEASSFYFRCGATGRELNAATRLVPAEDPDLLELTYEVTDPDLVSAGDRCRLTQTVTAGDGDRTPIEHPLATSPLAAPGSAWLAVEESASSEDFQIQYHAAGRYRVVLDLAEAFVSIERVGPAAPGQLAWSRMGYVVTNAEGELFARSFGSRTSLSPLDPATGRPRWRHQFGEQLFFSSECADDDLVVVADEGTLQAYQLVDGALRWSADFAGTLTHSSVLRCVPGTDLVAFTGGAASEEIVAVSRSSGRRLWTYRAPGQIWISHATADVFIVSRQEAAGRRFAAILDPATGDELWTHVGLPVFSKPDDQGNVFVVDGQKLHRIQPRDATKSWTFVGRDPFFGSYWRQGDDVLVQDADRLISLEVESGTVQWTAALPLDVDPYPLVTVLGEDRVLVWLADAGADRTVLLLHDSTDGSVSWRREVDGSRWSVAQDQAGHLWLTSQSALQRLSPTTGETVWSFALDPADPESAIFGIVAADADRVWLTVGPSFTKYPPMSLLTLDVHRGALGWQRQASGPLSVIGTDEQRVFVSSGEVVEAIRK